MANQAAGRSISVSISLNADGSATVRDNAAGFPVAIQDGVSIAQHIMTRLENAPSHGPLADPALCVVNACAETLILRIWRDDMEYMIAFKRGEPQGKLEIVRHDVKGRHGTEITFLPDADVLKSAKFDLANLVPPLTLLSQNTAASIALIDRRGTTPKPVDLSGQ
jgi:DNA gyrase subunit B